MDVGNPSNFARLQTVFNNSLDEFRSEISGYSYSDKQTRDSIKKVYDEFGYVADPHGAIGYHALAEYLADNDAVGVFLETAHPIKFNHDVEAIIGSKIPMPDSLTAVLDAEVKSQPCSTNYDDFKDLLEKLLT